MDFFRSRSSGGATGGPPSSPRPPLSRHTSNPPGAPRLSVIAEDSDRNSGANVAQSQPNRNRWSGLSGIAFSMKSKNAPPRVSAEMMPPPYARHGWVAEPLHEEPLEKSGGRGITTRRGGWGRVIAMLVLVVCVALALGVGLGVGLNRHHNDKSASSAGPSSTPNSTSTAAAFPLGEYSVNAALRQVQTNCTSNAATWRCFPYSIYSPSDPSTASASLSPFNWILSNTSSIFASNSTTKSTDSAGIPANISVSSSSNPFSITFSSIPLVYLNNDTRPRYIFNHTMSQQVIPSSALTSSNTASTCFFNDTLLLGTLYLSASPVSDFPPASLANSSLGGYTSWPFAASLRQVAAGGADVPACYETDNGAVGSRITGIFAEESADEQCVCEWASYAV
ncbi:hypothetical protein MBLNU459_g2347t1 [Dothideomycetes sp. NU459]